MLSVITTIIVALIALVLARFVAKHRPFPWSAPLRWLAERLSRRPDYFQDPWQGAAALSGATFYLTWACIMAATYHSTLNQWRLVHVVIGISVFVGALVYYIDPDQLCGLADGEQDADDQQDAPSNDEVDDGAKVGDEEDFQDSHGVDADYEPPLAEQDAQSPATRRQARRKCRASSVPSPTRALIQSSARNQSPPGRPTPEQPSELHKGSVPLLPCLATYAFLIGTALLVLGACVSYLRLEQHGEVCATISTPPVCTRTPRWVRPGDDTPINTSVFNGTHTRTPRTLPTRTQTRREDYQFHQWLQ